jgi:hypothetical protein
MMKPIASKEEILNAIRNSLLRDLRQTMDDSPATDEDNEDARKTVNLFIEDRLSHLSGAALLERFGTAEKIMDHYAAYLETRLRVGQSTIH